MKNKVSCFIIIVVALCFGNNIKAQQFTGTVGLFHVPSAEMNPQGTVDIGGYYFNKNFVPINFFHGKDMYHTFSYHVNVTFLSWAEIAYTCVLFKMGSPDNPDDIKYRNQDRHFSIRLRPLKEGKYWPAVVIGSDDPYSQSGSEAGYYSNYYVAATKHFMFKNEEVAAHLAYRYYKTANNKKWQGVVGGITYRPSFIKDLRLIAEYTGDEFNIAADYLILKHIKIQVAMQRMKYFSGGISYQLCLF